MIDFHPITLADRDAIRDIVYPTECRNCDLNFMNLLGWRTHYDTEVAYHDGWLLFRFKADGHNAYLGPVGRGEWAPIVRELIEDSRRVGHPFLMLGVLQSQLNYLNDAMPDYFYATADRSYTDYLYRRDSLATLAGKKLQQKRNHCNKFQKLYPDYEFVPLQADLIPECLCLLDSWKETKAEDDQARLTAEAERKSIECVFRHWEELEARGGVLKVGGRVVAFTYGGPVNYDTFDVCVEKADTRYDGAYAVINRDFARSLPDRYLYLNREEDLGSEGLRRAKESYKPEILLHKYTVMEKHPFSTNPLQE